MMLKIGWCDYDKGGRLYQASVDAFPEIWGLGLTRREAITDLNNKIEAASRAKGQYNTWTCH